MPPRVNFNLFSHWMLIVWIWALLCGFEVDAMEWHRVFLWEHMMHVCYMKILFTECTWIHITCESIYSCMMLSVLHISMLANCDIFKCEYSISCFEANFHFVNLQDYAWNLVLKVFDKYCITTSWSGHTFLQPYW